MPIETRDPSVYRPTPSSLGSADVQSTRISVQGAARIGTLLAWTDDLQPGGYERISVLRSIPREVVTAMHGIPLFSACNTRELREVARLGTVSEVATGSVVTTEGAVGSELIIILDGRATCRVKGKKLAQFGPGDFFGEMSLLDKGPRSATVVADENMEVLVLDSREFRRLIDVSPTIAWKIMVAMAGRLRIADTSLSH